MTPTRYRCGRCGIELSKEGLLPHKNREHPGNLCLPIQAVYYVTHICERCGATRELQAPLGCGPDWISMDWHDCPVRQPNILTNFIKKLESRIWHGAKNLRKQDSYSRDTSSV